MFEFGICVGMLLVIYTYYMINKEIKKFKDKEGEK